MLPTSLYIHIPWCIRKCPYCDFNSHKSTSDLPETVYIESLLADLKADLAYFPAREITTIFIGGGTPSLFSALAYEKLFIGLQQQIPFAKNIEITLEANPGSVEQQRFKAYRQLGINRLSLGLQSFNAAHLKLLGRIHDEQQAHQAVETARQAGFDNINIDLMYGLPTQSIAEGVDDLHTALTYQPEHLSWYQLTMEPNTVFYKKRPVLPDEDSIDLLEQRGLEILAEKGFKRYEISAFCQEEKVAHHNMNYWLFGDYYGIGAGAHGKITLDNGQVYRHRKQRQPKDYLNTDTPFLVANERLSDEALVFEFMLNTTRLQQKIPSLLFSERTSLPFSHLKPLLAKAAQKGLIEVEENFWQVTSLGRRYTNDLQGLFL